MQPLERIRVVGGRDRSGRHGFVVGPQVHHEAVTRVDTRLDSRLERSHRTSGLHEPLGKLNLERCARPMGDGRDPGDDVARHQPHGEAVRVLEDDRVVDGQVER